MSFKIIMDSCGEQTQAMKDSGLVVSVPLTIRVDNEVFVDDETLDMEDFLYKINHSTTCPTSACPSPGEFAEKYDCDADRLYVVTLSSELSGTYNSACLGKDIFLETSPDAQISIIDSKSAVCGETLLALKILEWESEGLNFAQVNQNVADFMKVQKTSFVLQDLTILQKSGRLSGIKALLAKTLHILPILGGKDGVICQLGQARGYRRALAALLAHIIEDCKKRLPKDLIIAHCNCLERANELKQRLREAFPKLIVHILETRGVSSLYANINGLVVSY
ncbi:MAG: DegV family protein [Clostridiales bacterium]|nr:DegV family protein [Clostridiales bacterium]